MNGTTGLPRRVTAVGLGVCVAGAIVVGAGTAAMAADAHSHAGTTTPASSSRVPTGPLAPEPPPLTAEQVAGHWGGSFPPVDPYDAKVPYGPAREEVSAWALSLSISSPSLDGSSLTAQQIAAAVVVAVPTTFSAVGAIDPDSASDPRIAPSRPVWAVTVHSPARSESTMYGTTDSIVPVYSILYDGPSGQVITIAMGVDYQKLGLPAA